MFQLENLACPKLFPAEKLGPHVRRLVVMAEDVPQPRALLVWPDVSGLLASVLAVVEREAG